MTGPRRVPLLTATLVATAMAVAGCGTAVRHPLDDSETRPASPWAATTEAAMTLDELGESTMSSLSFTSQEWVPDSGCDTYPEAPEQGDVGRVLARSYDALPGGATIDTLLDDHETAWKAQGRAVDRGSANMAPQVISRINGIGYALVSTPPGAELRAFLPCY